MGLSLSLVFLSNARGAVTWPGRYFALLPLLLAGGIALFLIVRAQRIQKNRPSPNDCQRCNYNLTGNVSGICPECGTPIEAEESRSCI
jgi:rRNA maturation endonuclease Nob1